MAHLSRLGWALALLAGASAATVQAQTTVTTTSAAAAVVVRRTVITTTPPAPVNGAPCTSIPPLADVVAPVTPSVDAGRQAAGGRNFALARANYRPLAQKGDPAGEAALGQLLMQNCTGLQDKEEGLTWLAKAVDGGDPDASLQLGTIYLNGSDGVAIDDNKAFAMISKAAATGMMVAQTDMAYMYLNGRGVPVDKYQGMVWAVKGGEQGSPAALSYISNAYFKGAGLPLDFNKAAVYGVAASRRANVTQKASFTAMLTNISRQMDPATIKDAAVRGVKWTLGPGSLSEVLRDAAKWRDQQAKAQASKN